MSGSAFTCVCPDMLELYRQGSRAQSNGHREVATEKQQL